MKEECKNCSVYEAGTCKCKDCNNICKKGSGDSSKGENRGKAHSTVRSNRNFFSGIGLENVITQLDDTELGYLIKIARNELYKRQMYMRKRMQKACKSPNEENDED